MKVRFRDHVVYWCARIAIGCAARVPERLGYGFAGWLGRMYFRCSARRRGYALHILRNAFPGRDEKELLRIGALSTGCLFQVPLDMARLTLLLARGGSLDEIVDYRESADMLKMKPPFLALTAHLGSWEVGAAAMAHSVGEAHCIARVSKNPLLQQWLLRNRERSGLHIHARRGGLRDLAKALERGCVGLQAVDQNQRLRGVFAPFFGEIASCERAAVTLAVRHGYPLAIGAGFRVDNRFRFSLVFLKPLVLELTGNKARDVHAGVVAVNAKLEELILRAPEQYLWIHDRYRMKPPPGWRPGVDGEGTDEAKDEGES